jgi:hypothetical protein
LAGKHSGVQRSLGAYNFGFTIFCYCATWISVLFCIDKRVICFCKLHQVIQP